MIDINDIMKQAAALQEKMQGMQAQLENVSAQGQSGGGMVKVVINGKGAMKSVEIDPSLLAADEKDVLEDLIVAAFNDAKTKVEAQASEEMQKLAGGMGLPPGFKMPF